MTFNAGLGFENSYYLATAQAAEANPPLAADTEADVVIVGGGATGLSAALHAAGRGASVVLLEGGRIGWGASGRNGGQIIPGLRMGATDLAARLGEERARRVLELAFEARDLVVGLIERHAINCDLRLTGHLAAAARPKHLEGMLEDCAKLSDMGFTRGLRGVDKGSIGDLVGADYVGGVFDPAGGHFHPLNYALGLARAAASAGVRMFETSPATGVAQDGGGVTVTTGAGRVRARHAVLAGDALLAGLAPRAEARIMPVASYVAVTEPLDFAAELIPSNAAVSDSRFVVNYYRLTPDGRLLFGGGERYSRRPPADIAAFVRPHMERVFPAVKGARIDHAWGGLVSITRTRLPHLAREGNILIAHGYSGMGAALSTLAGQLIADAIAGETERFDLLADLPAPAFPGGASLRAPLHVAGMLWYATRDRL
ncbi:MAG: NAD(P)/FAD-dependent oxidoreductase [Caulobacteraceae bacterium]